MRDSKARRLTYVVCCMLSLTVTSRALLAQRQGVARLAAVMDGIPPGTRLRIETRGTHIGRLKSVGADSILLGEDDGPRTVALADIRTVAQEVRGYRRGAVVGAATGAAVFALAGIVLVDGFCETTRCGSSLSHATGGAAIGVVVGGVLGAGLGLLTHDWRELYPRD